MCFGHYADMAWTPHSRPGLDVKTDNITHTPKGYERFVTHVMKLSIESSEGFLSYQKMT